MDEEGFVPLTVIGRFNRVRALTQDVPLIKEVSWILLVVNSVTVGSFLQSLTNSEVIEMHSAGEKLRQKNGWERWVFAGREQLDYVVKLQLNLACRVANRHVLLWLYPCLQVALMSRGSLWPPLQCITVPKMGI